MNLLNTTTPEKIKGKGKGKKKRDRFMDFFARENRCWQMPLLSSVATARFSHEQLDSTNILPTCKIAIGSLAVDQLSFPLCECVQ